MANVTEEVHVLVVSAHRVFDTLEALGVFVLIVVIFAIVALSCSACARLILRRWAWPDNVNKLVQYALLLTFAFIGFVAALATAAPSMVHLAASLGLVSIVASIFLSSGCAGAVGDVANGILLQFEPLVERRTTIELRGEGVRGRIVSMNLFRVAVEPFDDSLERPPRLLYISNTRLRNALFEFETGEFVRAVEPKRRLDVVAAPPLEFDPTLARRRFHAAQPYSDESF